MSAVYHGRSSEPTRLKGLVFVHQQCNIDFLKIPHLILIISGYSQAQPLNSSQSRVSASLVMAPQYAPSARIIVKTSDT